MSSNREGRSVPQWMLERLAAGELPPAQAEALRRELADAGELGRLDELQRQNVEALAAHPPGTVAAEVRRRAAAAPARRRSWMLFALPTLAAGALAAGALLVAVPRNVTTPDQPEHVIKKGLQPHLTVFRKSGDRAEALRPGQPVRSGDVLQVAYVASGARHGAIVSVDSRKAVSWHMPEQPGAAAPLRDGGAVLVAHAYELDATPGSETFVFLSSASAQPFDAAAAVDALQAGRPLPPDVKLFRLALPKELP
jgi:hypothetical protein